MIQFWLLAAAMFGATLAWLMVPLLRQSRYNELDRDAQNVSIARARLDDLERSRQQGEIDDGEYQSVRQELEQSLALDLHQETQAKAFSHTNSPILAATLVFLIPVISGALYLMVGSPVSIVNPAPQVVAETGHDEQPPSVEEMMARLKQRLAEHPEDTRGWQILARSSMALERFDDAVAAYEQLNQLMPGNPDIQVGFADALAMQADGILLGRPSELLDIAIQGNPFHIQGLWLSGMAAQQRGEFQLAMNHWQKLLPLLSNDPESRSQLGNLIQDLVAEASLSGLQLAVDPADESQTPAGVQIAVDVMVATDVAANASPDDTVFVFARDVQGPPMPLAAARLKRSDLPARIILDDSSAMMPGRTLSSVSKVQVVARVSKSGQPTASSGDLEGLSEVLKTDRSHVISIQIDRVVE